MCLTEIIFIWLLKTINFHELLFDSLTMGLYIPIGNTFSIDKEQCLFLFYDYDPNIFLGFIENLIQFL